MDVCLFDGGVSGGSRTAKPKNTRKRARVVVGLFKVDRFCFGKKFTAPSISTSVVLLSYKKDFTSQSQHYSQLSNMVFGDMP